MAPHRLRRAEVTLQKVLFDSSFLMAVVEHPTTWYEDIVDGVGKFQPVMLECVKEELEKIALGQGKKSRVARLSLEMASEFEVDPCGSARVDDEIVSAAVTCGAMVATVDSELTRAAKRAHQRVITLRKGRVALG